jgi:general secretion pathway protein I
MPRHHERGSNHGFTLLEILVALVIFALAFGVVAQIVQTGLRQSGVARSLTAATLLAQSELARVGVEVPLRAGPADGETETGMRWHTEVELIEQPNEQQSLATYQVQVTVSWGRNPAEQLTLTTLRTGLPSE